ncbi:type II toxin-antitoxin system YafQ family toxin [bacterium]|nr:type II toxin-antitoxin system YafQ family toxin [bacterium]
MLKIKRTGQFKRDYKLMKKRGKDMKKLRELVEKLFMEEYLDKKYHDHPLLGKWEGARDYHLETDWILIYTRTGNEIILERTGTHSDLFK